MGKMIIIPAIFVPDFLHPFGDASKLTKSAAFRCCKLTMWLTHHIPRETAVAPSSSVPVPCPRRDLADPGIQVAPLESPVSLCSETFLEGKKTQHHEDCYGYQPKWTLIVGPRK